MSEVRNLSFDLLSSENINYFDDFTCGDNDLNDFIKNDALETQKAHIAVTNLIFYESNPIGFFSLCCDSIKLDDSEIKKRGDKLKIRGRRYIDYPALKIARLAICDDSQFKGIGTSVFLFILGFVVEELRPKIGTRFISVDAYANSVDFYKKLGFIFNKRENQEARDRHREKLQSISMRFDTLPIKIKKDNSEEVC